MRCAIREATPADASALVELVRRLTREDNGRDSLLTPTHLAKECFGSTARFSVLLAEQAGRAVGYAAFHRSYDTDHAAKGFYLQDLYVEPDVRRQGIGRALLAAVARVPVRQMAVVICSGTRSPTTPPAVPSTVGSVPAKSRWSP